MRLAALCLAFVVSICAATAQTPAPSDAAKAMVGTWELSNSERDQLCNLTFKTDPAKSGFRVEYDPACGDGIPVLKDVEGWSFVNETLRLLDARGRIVFEMSEVEVGMFEGERKGEGLYFLQTAESAAAFAPKRSVEEIAGEWTLLRSDKPVCSMTLTDRATKGFDEFLLSLQGGCDPAMAKLAPNVWRLDRGELVLASPNGQAWRFQENEPKRWRRVPEGAEPLELLKR
jgi:hypothetical protein